MPHWPSGRRAEVERGFATPSFPLRADDIATTETGHRPDEPLIRFRDPIRDDDAPAAAEHVAKAQRLARLVVDANLFALTANGGITYPFTFDGQTLTVPSLRVTQQALLPGAASDPYTPAVREVDPGASSDDWREIPGTAIVVNPDALWSISFSGTTVLTATAIGNANLIQSSRLEVCLGVDGAPYTDAAFAVASTSAGGGSGGSNTFTTPIVRGPAALEVYQAGQARRFSLLYKFKAGAGCTGRIIYAQLKAIVNKR